MNPVASGVAHCAEMIRSPSFSRPASSTTTTNSPLRIAVRACSILANVMSSGVKAGGGWRVRQRPSADVAQLVVDGIVERMHAEVAPEPVEPRFAGGRARAHRLEHAARD